MKFDNDTLIYQAQITQVNEIEPMYWIVEDELYNNNKQKAQAVLEMLLYVAHFRPDIIKSGLKPAHRKKLRELSYEIMCNEAIRHKNSINMRPSVNACDIPFKLECELKNYLYENVNILNAALDDDIKKIDMEVETDSEYRCDLVAESKSKFYPIELKINQATHAVVSQCSKYCHYFYRKLRYNHYKELQGVVICRGYDTWSVNELRREGHWIFNILSDDKDKIVLKKIV